MFSANSVETADVAPLNAGERLVNARTTLGESALLTIGDPVVEPLLGVARAELGGAATLPRSFGIHLPSHDVVGEVEGEHAVEPCLVLRVRDRHHDLDAPVEVAR